MSARTMGLLNGSGSDWLLHLLGLREACSQTSLAERACLAKHAAGKRSLVEIGVMHGVGTALLQAAMDPAGTLIAIDPHPPGRLGISFERLIARREIARRPRGHVALLRKLSYEAALDWNRGIDFLFVDGDHSWTGIDRDWRDWSKFVQVGGVVALHDSQSVVGLDDLDSVRYTRENILSDKSFRTIDLVDSMTVLERVAASPALRECSAQLRAASGPAQQRLGTKAILGRSTP